MSRFDRALPQRYRVGGEPVNFGRRRRRAFGPRELVAAAEERFGVVDEVL